MILLVISVQAQLAAAQDWVKMDVFAIMDSGVGLSYEHHFNSRISSDLLVRNTKLEPVCFDIFNCDNYIRNVGRDWTVLYSTKYHLNPDDSRHKFSVGLGLEYHKRYDLSDEYIEAYMEFYSAIFRAEDFISLVPVFEYKFVIRDKYCIGFNYFAFNSRSQIGATLNLGLML